MEVTMGKPTNGPDMQDCCIFLGSIEETHKCACCVLLEPGGPGVGADWRVSVVASSRILTLSGPAWTETAVGRWPDHKSKEFPTMLMSLLYALDYKCTPAEYRAAMNLT
jgi:hypothetical protein